MRTITGRGIAYMAAGIGAIVLWVAAGNLTAVAAGGSCLSGGCGGSGGGSGGERCRTVCTSTNGGAQQCQQVCDGGGKGGGGSGGEGGGGGNDGGNGEQCGPAVPVGPRQRSSSIELGRSSTSVTKVIFYTQAVNQVCTNDCGDPFDKPGTQMTSELVTVPITKDCPNGKGDPVLMPSGEFTDSVVDLIVPVGKDGIGFSRAYRSFSEVNGVLGHGWDFAQLKTLTVGDDSSVSINYVDGYVMRFTYGNGTYAPAGGFYGQLDKVGADYIFTDAAGGKWYFDGTHSIRTKTTDPVGNATLYYYDANCNLTGITDAVSRQYSLQYDAGGRLTRTSDFGGRSVVYQYDTNNDLLTKVTLPWGPGGGVSYTYTYDSVQVGTKLYTMLKTRRLGADPSDNLTLYYDSGGRVTRQTLGAGDYVWTYAAGNVITQVDRQGNRQVYYYDNAGGNQTKEVVQMNRGVRPGDSDYVTTWNFDGKNNPSTRLLPGGTEETKLYDANGNLCTRKYTRGATSVTELAWYDANNKRTKFEDGRGQATRYEYDANRNLKTKTMPAVNLGQSEAQIVRTTYEYNAAGLTTREVNPNGVVTAMLYDGNGYLTKRIVDVGGLALTTETKYDAFGNVTERVSPESAKQTYYYDGGRLLTKEVRILDNDDPSKQYAISYWYDASERVVSKKTEHKDQGGNSLSPSEWLENCQYDLEGRVTKQVYQVDGMNSVTHSYVYNGEGAISKKVLPNGTEEGYVYDERNQLYQKINCGGCGSTSISLYTNETGQLTKRVEALGNSTVMAYDGLDRVTRISYYDNQATPQLLSYDEQEYDANNNVTRRTIRDAANTVVGRTTNCYDEISRLYETREWANPGSAEGDNDARTVMLYDAASRLTKQRHALAGADATPVWAETSYYYDNAGRQTRVVDAEGGAVSYYYDKDGRITRQTDAEGHSGDYAYDLIGRVTRQTNAVGHYTVVSYDSFGRALTTISYASNGTAQARSAQDYDGLGRVTLSRTFADPAGAADDAKDYKTLTYYDAIGLVTKTTDALGNNSTAYYDTSNRLQWSRDPLGNKEEYVYDNNNNRITTINYEIDQVNGATKTFTAAALYDGRNRATKIVGHGADGDITQTSDNPVEAVYYDALNRQTCMIDAVGTVSAAYYDGLGRTTRQVVDVGGVATTSGAQYDRASRQTKSLDPLDNASQYEYDKLGRATKTTDPIGNYVIVLYDAGGEATRRTNYEVDQAGGGGKTFVFDSVYDNLGRVTKIISQGKDGDISQIADNAETVTYFDALGRQTKVTAPEGVATVWYYDGLSRLTRQTEDFGGLNRNADRAYDKAGKMTRITDDLGQNTDYVYDARGRLTKTIYSDHDAAGDEVVTLYAFGSQPMKRIDQRGIETKFIYDGMGRLITKQDAWSTPTIVETFAYDKAGRKTMAVLANGGTTVSDVRQYYDSAGRLTRESQQIRGGDIRNVDYAYNCVGNRTKLAYPGASRVVNYAYDAGNRVSLIKDSANAVAQYLYVGQARVSERKYMKASDGSTEVTTLHALYDGAANITRFYHDKSDNSVVVGFQYDYDKMGNPQYKLREHQGNYGDEYMYDKLYRLTRTVYDDSTPATTTVSPAAAVTDAFGYDSIGNRTSCYLKSATVTSYLHNPVNEYTKESTGGTDKYYGSDAAGNLTRVAAASVTDTDGDWRYYYDYENQMTKAEKREGGAWVTKGEYTRDALMRRVEKVTAGATIRYYHDGWRAIEETEGTDTPSVERQYVFGNEIDEALVLFKSNGGNYDTYYYLADGQWTVEALVNDSGVIVETYAYRVYGEPAIKTGVGNDDTWFTADDATSGNSIYGNTILFTGRNYDSESGLYYYRMRMYDAESGRFLGHDAMRYREGMNLFEYLASRPVAGTDPLGLAKKPKMIPCTQVKREAPLGTRWTLLGDYPSGCVFSGIGVGTCDVSCVCTLNVTITYQCCDGSSPQLADVDYMLVGSGLEAQDAVQLSAPIPIPIGYGQFATLPGLSAARFTGAGARDAGIRITACRDKCAALTARSGTDGTKNFPKVPEVTECDCKK